MTSGFNFAYIAALNEGIVGDGIPKDTTRFIWPVRGGQ